MLVLGQKKEPHRIVIREAVGKPGRKGFEPEAFVVAAPITQAILRRASRVVARVFGRVTDVAEMNIDELLDRTDLGAIEMIRMGIVEWGGIGGTDGKPLAVTPDRETRLATATDENRPSGTIDLMLEDEVIVALITDAYVRPDAQRRAEKNASSASPNGTSAAATRASATANSPANRKTRRAGAKSARTASMRSAAKPASKSGKR